MEYLHSLILGIHVLVGVSVIGLVLIQHGKGADMGAAFGSGASGSLFGASGSANFLSRTTAILAAVFFCTSLGLSYIASTAPRSSTSVMDRVPVPAPASAPTPATTGEAPGGSKAKDIPQ